MIGCRDPLGVRPLVLGDLDGADDPRLGDLRARHHRRPLRARRRARRDGHRHRRTGSRACSPSPPATSRFCIFEYVYFARPDSSVEGRGVYEVRKRIGAELAREQPATADLVVPVPDSGTPAAIGYAEAAGLPFDLGIIRNHYVGRTFIEPTDAIRHMGVRLKHNANRDVLAGKRVVLVDDSIVRGTTSLKIVQMIREAGAAEVHMRIASPPTTHSCFYGVDTPEKSQLIASRMSVEEMADFIKVDSLAFLSIDGLYRAVGEAARDSGQPQFCDACFTGDYPTRLTDREAAEQHPPLPARRGSRLSSGRPGRTASPSSPAPRAASAARRRWGWPRPAPMWSRWRAPSAAWRSSTTPSAPRAARPRWCRSTSRTSPASTGSAPRSTSAGASSTCSSAMPACSARSRRSAISSRRSGTRRWPST